MDKTTAIVRSQNWLRIINECNSRPSGTKEEWCADNGISIRAFYYWQRKLRQETAEQLIAAGNSENKKPVAGNESQLPSPIAFADLTQLLDQEPEQAAPVSEIKAPTTIPELIIQIRDCRVIVNSSITEQTLATVLRSIRDA